MSDEGYLAAMKSMGYTECPACKQWTMDPDRLCHHCGFYIGVWPESWLPKDRPHLPDPRWSTPPPGTAWNPIEPVAPGTDVGNLHTVQYSDPEPAASFYDDAPPIDFDLATLMAAVEEWEHTPNPVVDLYCSVEDVKGEHKIVNPVIVVAGRGYYACCSTCVPDGATFYRPKDNPEQWARILAAVQRRAAIIKARVEGAR